MPACPGPPACTACTAPLQYTLYHLFGYAYGSSTFLLAKLAGVADKALLPVTLLTLKARLEGWEVQH